MCEKDLISIVDDDHRLKEKYNRKKGNAKNVQHIKFELSFFEYAKLVSDAGIKSSDLGYNGNQYVLARYGDCGPYSIDNCRFILQKDNLNERHSKSVISINVKAKEKKHKNNLFSKNRKCAECGKRIRNDNKSGLCVNCYNEWRASNATEHTKYYKSITIAQQLLDNPNLIPIPPEYRYTKCKRSKKKKNIIKIYDLQVRLTSVPKRDVLIRDLKEMKNFKKIGKKYGVSDNAVRKWCKKYKLPYRASDIKVMTQSDWDDII